MRERLVQVRNLLAVLGMLGPITDPPPLLVIAEPFTLDAAADLEKPCQAYPDFQTDFTLDRRRTSCGPRSRRTPGRSTGPCWSRPGSWSPASSARITGTPCASRLKKPAELAPWRALARVLDRLRDHPEGLEPIDPVTDLLRFLDQPYFTIAPSRSC